MPNNIKLSAEEIIECVNISQSHSISLIFPSKPDLCVTFAQVNPVVEDLKGQYSICFFNQATNPAQETMVKNWNEVETITNVDFTNMLAQGFDIKHLGAHFFAKNTDELSKIINLCLDICNSMNLDGHVPLNTGDLFKKYNKSSNTPMDFSGSVPQYPIPL